MVTLSWQTLSLSQVGLENSSEDMYRHMKKCEDILLKLTLSDTF